MPALLLLSLSTVHYAVWPHTVCATHAQRCPGLLGIRYPATRVSGWLQFQPARVELCFQLGQRLDQRWVMILCALESAWKGRCFQGPTFDERWKFFLIQHWFCNCLSYLVCCLLSGLLTVNPLERLSMDAVVHHKWIFGERPSSAGTSLPLLSAPALEPQRKIPRPRSLYPEKRPAFKLRSVDVAPLAKRRRHHKLSIGSESPRDSSSASDSSLPGSATGELLLVGSVA